MKMLPLDQSECTWLPNCVAHDRCFTPLLIMNGFFYPPSPFSTYDLNIYNLKEIQDFN